MGDFLAKTFGVALGTNVISFLVRVIIALVMLYTGSATSFGDAVGIAIDKERSIAAAAHLINDTPTPEIKKALVEEKIEESK